MRNLDAITVRDAPLDILAQQIVATCAAEDLPEHELIEMIRGAAPYAEIGDERLEQLMVMLSEGVSDRRGRSGAHLHRDRVGGMVRARRGARLAAITSGGAIPDNNNYTVVQLPEETPVGSVDEDFAIDSSPGDIFYAPRICMVDPARTNERPTGMRRGRYSRCWVRGPMR